MSLPNSNLPNGASVPGLLPTTFPLERTPPPHPSHPSTDRPGMPPPNSSMPNGASVPGLLPTTFPVARTPPQHPSHPPTDRPSMSLPNSNMPNGACVPGLLQTTFPFATTANPSIQPSASTTSNLGIQPSASTPNLGPNPPPGVLVRGHSGLGINQLAGVQPLASNAPVLGIPLSAPTSLPADAAMASFLAAQIAQTSDVASLQALYATLGGARDRGGLASLPGQPVQRASADYTWPALHSVPPTISQHLNAATFQPPPFPSGFSANANQGGLIFPGSWNGAMPIGSGDGGGGLAALPCQPFQRASTWPQVPPPSLHQLGAAPFQLPHVPMPFMNAHASHAGLLFQAPPFQSTLGGNLAAANVASDRPPRYRGTSLTRITQTHRTTIGP